MGLGGSREDKGVVAEARGLRYPTPKIGLWGWMGWVDGLEMGWSSLYGQRLMMGVKMRKQGQDGETGSSWGFVHFGYLLSRTDRGWSNCEGKGEREGQISI